MATFSTVRTGVLALVLAGCGSKPPPAGPIEVLPAMYQADGTLVRVNDGDSIFLEVPPQGGHVLFVGALVRNLQNDHASIRGRLRHSADNSIVGEEGRTVTLTDSPDDPTLMLTTPFDIANVSNIPVCPAYTPYDLYDQPMTLEVTITDDDSGREGTGSRMVMPSCTQADDFGQKFCRCECGANFTLGKCGNL